MDYSLIKLIKEKQAEWNLPIYELGYSTGEEEGQFYFGEAPKLRPIYSLSKNFLSLTYGALCLTLPIDFSKDVFSIFANDYPTIPEIWKEVRIEDVLTQRVGIENGFLDIDQEDMEQYGNDYLLSVLAHTPTYKPGTKFVYSDSNYYLASRILEKISGESYESLLKRLILTPLGIRLSKETLKDPSYRLMGATGLFFHAKEVARLGTLVSQKGLYKGKRLCSKEYIEKSISPLVKVNEKTGYGYSFWNDLSSNTTYGNGMYGQFLINRGGVSICYFADSRRGDLHHLDELLLSWKKGGS